jgi:hypothetical protein
MKKFMLAAFVIVASVAQAAEVVVLEAELPVVARGREFATSKFHMDTKTGEGFVKTSVTEEVTVWTTETWCNAQFCQSGPIARTSVNQVLAETTKIANLVLMGNDAVYQGAEGNVVCGTLKPSRIFRVPTLYLSGNCKLETQIMRSGLSGKLVVTLRTK